MKKSFKKSDFLSDKIFLSWRLYRTVELDQYWEDFMEKNPDSREAIEEAAKAFDSVRISDARLSDAEMDMLDGRIRGSILARFRVRRAMRIVSAAAAVVLLAIGVTWFGGKMTDHEPLITAETVVGKLLPRDSVILIMGGQVMPLRENADIRILTDGRIEVPGVDAGQPSVVDVSGIADNLLVVPYGRLSTIVFEDGTKVWLNAGTELSFPSNFTDRERRIRVKGEIYLEVAHDAARPFLVDTKDFTVHVHGTSFNVSCYEDSSIPSVVLAQGSVAVESEGGRLMMEPSQMFTLEGGTAHIAEVDVEEYISWKDGVLILRNHSVDSILEKVGRYYNTTFTHSNPAFVSKTFTGKLKLSSDIEEVMDFLCAITDAQYTKVGDEIYINGRE